MSAKLLNQQVPQGGGAVTFKVPEGDTFGLVQVFPIAGGPAYSGAVIAFEGSQDATFGTNPVFPPGNDLPPSVLTIPTIMNLFGIRTDDGFTQDLNGPLPYTTPAPGFAIPNGISRAWTVAWGGCTLFRLRVPQLTVGPMGVSFQSFGPFAGGSSPAAGLIPVNTAGANNILTGMLFELIELRLAFYNAYGLGFDYKDPTPTIIPQTSL
jgi:hypothetical protein